MTTALHLAVYAADGSQILLRDWQMGGNVDRWKLELVQRASQPDENVSATSILSYQDLIDLHRAIGAALNSVGLLTRSNN